MFMFMFMFIYVYVYLRLRLVLKGVLVVVVGVVVAAIVFYSLFFILFRMVISYMYIYICVFVKMDGRYLVYVCNHCWLTSITHNRDIPYLPHNYYTYFDHIDTCTSPTCSLSSINMQSLDCPIPPPIVSGN